MKNIQIFDPSLCCSSGVCGPDVDPEVLRFSADVNWAKQAGMAIERFNLAQQPLAFAENALVRDLLEKSGEKALPVAIVDGGIRCLGRYPTREELTQWAEATPRQPLAIPVVEASARSSACGPRGAPSKSGCC